MRQNPLPCLLLLCVISATPTSSFSHDTPIHKALTETAALASPGLEGFIADQLGEAGAPFLVGPKLVWDPGVTPNVFVAGGFSPIAWMKAGSVMEDDQEYSYGILGTRKPRTQNHFFDPTKVPPGKLTDGFDGFGTGMDSFTWAWKLDADSTWCQNHDSWQNARNYQYAAVTSGPKSARDQNLAHALYSLGHVLHLNQDLSQPDHTRNDNHNRDFPTHDTHVWIEPHGWSNFKKRADWFTPPPPSQRGWLYWRDSGFANLVSFWDRNLYAGTPQQQKQALDDDANASPGKQLGLAEFSNGNFLGEDASYIDSYPPLPSKHRFPFPSLYSSTTFPQLLASFMGGEEQIHYRDGSVGTHVYVRKNGDGIPVPHHSRLTYLSAALWGQGTVVNFLETTLNDPKVLDDYHAILLPKAVKYSAGILDYFFRGKLEVATLWTGSAYKIRMKNRSGQAFGPGSFTLLQEAENGDRTAVTLNLTYGNELAEGAYIDGTFAGPVTAPTKHILVFKGTIGTGAGLDPVDAGIAVAAKCFTVEPPTTLGTLTSDIQRVRIKDYASYAAQLNQPCPDCEADTMHLQWDGTFPHPVSWSTWKSDTVNPTSFDINARRMGNSQVYYGGYYSGEHGSHDAFWAVQVFCTYYDPAPPFPGYRLRSIWDGVKTTGDTPIGTYWRDAIRTDCYDTSLPDTLTVEGY